MKLNQRGFHLAEVIILVVVVGALGGVGGVVYKEKQKSRQPKPAAITNFDECVAAGNPVAESYPEQCHAGGKTFINEKQQNQMSDEIPADEPAAGNKKVAYESLPKDLREAIFATFRSKAPGCVEGNDYKSTVEKDYLINAYKAGNSALGTLGCEGGSAVLYVVLDNKWVFLESTQMGFECSIINAHKVSKDVVSSCIDGDGKSRQVTNP